MRWYRFLPFLLTAACVVLLAGALREPAARSQAEPISAPRELVGLENEVADPVATMHVDQALTALRDPSREWMNAGVWLRSHLPELPYEGEGVYYRAPHHRYRLELRLKRAGRTGERTLLTLGDGHDRWQAMRAGGRYRNVRRTRQGGPASAGPADKFVRGPEALLRSFDGTIAWVRSKPEGDGVVVTGIWHAGPRQRLAPAKQPWPASLPRVCRMTLRGKDRWPSRLEWWGPTTAGGTDHLLVELEFRDPSWGKPLSDDQCARLFTFDPGDAPVVQVTEAGTP